MTRFEAYKGGLFKADLAEGVWIYFHSRIIEEVISGLEGYKFSVHDLNLAYFKINGYRGIIKYTKEANS